MTLHEPDVSLTDFGLAVECAIFVVFLAGRDAVFNLLNGSFLVFFAATGLAALLGGAAHGFVGDVPGNVEK